MRNVLFVDDETNVLLAIKRMLRPHRNEWKMDFVESGAEALKLLENEKYDVVVSDMRMPEMDGAELLEIVMKKYPHIIRIILSGFSEQELIMKSVRPTHQFISKPCDASTLISTIQRACDLHDKLASEKIKNIIMRIDSLPSLPMLYDKIIKELRDPDVPLKHIASIIKQDVGMTAKILKLVNSSFFGLSNTISDPAQAVSLLGLNTVKTLVLSLEIFSVFKPSDKIVFSFMDLWKHSTLTALFCKEIAKTISKKPQFIEDAFTVGFLHDIGILTLITKLPEEYSTILEIYNKEKIPIWEAELKVIDTTHAEIGAYLLMLWGFADNIVDAIAQHHKPVIESENQQQLVSIVHFSDVFSELLKKSNNENILSEFSIDYLEKTNVSEESKEWINICEKIYETGELNEL